MPELPDHPNLDQLRHQARDLLDAANAGEPNGLRRLRSVSSETTLASAQLAVAREYGYQSWPALKKAVEGRARFGPAATASSRDAGATDHPRAALATTEDLEFFHDEHSVRVRVPLDEDPFTPDLHRWIGEYRPLAKSRGINAFVEEHPGKVQLEVRLGLGLSEDEILRKLDEALDLILEAKAAAGSAGVRAEDTEALVRRWWREKST